LARVLAAAGYHAEKEYLVNDQFTQVDNFAGTLLARYKQLFGREAEIPENGYPGEYVIDLAKELKDEFGDKWLNDDVAPDDLRRLGIERMIARIRGDLEAMGIIYDQWFFEHTLYETGVYEQAMQLLRDQGAIVDKEGAVWLN